VISRFVGGRLLKRFTGGKVQRVGRIQALVRLPSLLRITVALLRDSRVPVWQRASVVGLVVLILSPIDVIGDIPLVGQFWDFTLAVTVLDAFIQMAPADAVNEHIVALGLQNKIPLREK
jgi:uncharacterized membrane protein YkvA (DUF1232 family)